MTTGERVKLYRKRNGLSQRELGQIIGMSPATISVIENRNRAFSTDILIEFCKVFECLPSDIVIVC